MSDASDFFRAVGSVGMTAAQFAELKDCIIDPMFDLKALPPILSIELEETGDCSADNRLNLSWGPIWMFSYERRSQVTDRLNEKGRVMLKKYLTSKSDGTMLVIFRNSAFVVMPVVRHLPEFSDAVN